MHRVAKGGILTTALLLGAGTAVAEAVEANDYWTSRPVLILADQEEAASVPGSSYDSNGSTFLQLAAQEAAPFHDAQALTASNQVAQTQATTPASYRRDDSVRPAVDDTFYFTLTGSYIFIEPPNKAVDQRSTDTASVDGEAVFPFDLGLSRGNDLDAFAWRVSANVGHKFNRSTGISAIINPFWRDPDIGMFGPTLRFLNQHSVVTGMATQSIFYGAEGELYLLDYFNFGAGYTYRDAENFHTHNFSGFIDFFPISDIALTLTTSYSDVESETGGPGDESYTTAYQIEWLPFPDEPNTPSIFVGGSNVFGDSKGSYSVEAGFRIWFGPNPGTLKERSRTR